MRYVKNQSGVALMIVLAAIALLTSVTTEFAYNTNINYNLALNDKERMQAYFLAQSSINLMKLELKLEKEFKTNLSNSPAAGMISANLGGPLCQQFPMSTGLFRVLFLGQTGSEPAEGESKGEKGEEKAEEPAEAAAFISATQVEAAEEFLDFEGDFEGGCEDEAAKFNLNIFAGKNPIQESMAGLNEYDKSKQMLINILSRPEFSKLFPEDKDKTISEIARNIADWIDIDTRINEIGGTSTGSESSVYKAGITGYEVKNGKYLTLDELYLVGGVADAWFNPIKDRFTVYGGDKINVCLASDEAVAALIVQYANSNQNVPDVNPAEKVKMANYVSVVKNSCTGATPNTNQIAQALDQALGVTSPSSDSSGSSESTSSSSSGGFASMITTESRYYTLMGTGIVRDTEVKIIAVLDASGSPNSWKYVYWRVE